MNPIILPIQGGIMGFTGTRDGLTQAQMTGLAKMLHRCQPYQVQHGDCIGADAMLHSMAFAKGIMICIRPPTDDRLRAHCYTEFPNVSIRPPRPYIARNHDIVKYCSYLVACPKEMQEIVRSGTWATVRWAESHDKPVYLILPDGSLDRRPPV